MRRVTGYLEYVTREGDTFDSLALQMYNEETEPLVEGGDDGMNHDNILREQNPLDMGDVTLVLWSIE